MFAPPLGIVLRFETVHAVEKRMDAVTGTPTILSLARIAPQNVRVLRTVGSR